MGGGARRNSLRPALGVSVEELPHRGADQRPARREPGDERVQRAADQEASLHAAMIAGAQVGFGALSVVRTAIAASLSLVLMAGCGGGGEESSSVALPAGCSEVATPAPKQVKLSRPTDALRGSATATVETSCGTFEIALDVARAPKTTSSFAYLARQGAYDDTPFHRIVPGFVIQGGDPTGSGTGGPGYHVDEPP